MGNSKYYTRNKDSTHETILDSKFMDPLFWIRVNKHFASQNYYQKNADKFKINQVIHLVNPIFNHRVE